MVLFLKMMFMDIDGIFALQIILGRLAKSNRHNFFRLLFHLLGWDAVLTITM